MAKSATIINVDDSEQARYVRAHVLSRAGFIVHDAATGSECLKLIAEHAPDLVLLDVNLPDMSGLEACRLLKVAAELAQQKEPPALAPDRRAEV